MSRDGEHVEARLRELELLVRQLQSELVTTRDTIAHLQKGSRGTLLVETLAGIADDASGACKVIERDADAEDDIDSGQEVYVRSKLTGWVGSGVRGLASYMPGWNEWWLTLAGLQICIGKLDGPITAGGTQTVSVWSGSAGSEADSGEDIVAADWLMKVGAAAIATGKKVVCAQINGTWYIIEAECP